MSTDSVSGAGGGPVGVPEFRRRRACLLLCAVVLTILPVQWSAFPRSTEVSKARSAPFKVLAVENFLADMARNVAGGRMEVESLLPVGADPHGFEPTPADARKVAACDLLLVNGAGFETFLERLLESVGGERPVLVASAGLEPRRSAGGQEEEHGHEGEADPHFWLDPVLAVRYVENMRDGFSAADPEERAAYAADAASYAAKLRELDSWVRGQVEKVPPGRRILVTNHESFGYFAERYGFRVVGTIIPSVSSGASPSARRVAQVIEVIRSSGARAIFLETGTNPALARQISRETGARVVEGLYTHSLSGDKGNAPTYIDMMRFNVKTIVDALR